MSKKTSRKQVAKIAGVSEATVSRVYNNPKSVSADKVEKVMAAANRLGYSPNKYASALRRKGTGVILFLERNQAEGYQWTQIRHYNAFYAEIIRTLANEAENSLYHLRLRTIENDDEIIELAKTQLCDGIIGFNFETEQSARILQQTNMPYVCCHHTEGFSDLNRVATDNYFGGSLQAKQLMEAGYQRPAYVTGSLEDTFSHRERMRGFSSQWSNTSVPLIETEPSIQGGQRAAEKVLKLLESGSIDSVGVVNDLTAIGMIQVFYNKNIKIPADIAIVGYDNLPAISALPIALTTIDLNLPKLYKKAFWSLLDIIQNEKQVSKKIKPEICKGNSA